MHVTFTAETKAIVLPINVLHKHPCTEQEETGIWRAAGDGWKECALPASQETQPRLFAELLIVLFPPEPKELQWLG